MRRARFSVLSRQPEQPHPSIPQSDSTSVQFGNEKLPNHYHPTLHQISDENEDELIPYPYDSRISFERVWGTNVPVMDHDIFKLHHPFSMLVAGPEVLEKVSS